MMMFKTFAVVVVGVIMMFSIALGDTTPYPYDQLHVLDFGTLGGNDSCAYAINDLGQIVGSSINAAGNERAFIWNSVDGIQDLGRPGTAYDINNASQIIGDSWFMDQGITTLLPGIPHGLNNHGQVVGMTYPGWQAFVWNSVDGLQLLGRESSEGTAINDNGWVAVNIFCDDAYILNLYTGETRLCISNLQADSKVYGLNNCETPVGAVIWSAPLVPPPLSDSCLWEYVELYGPYYFSVSIGLADNEGIALAINDHGHVIGNVETPESSCIPFLYDSTHGTRDINDILISGHGWILTNVTDINNAGWIIGSGLNPQGENHAFLLIPDPFPGDANGDGIVDYQDLGTIAVNYGLMGKQYEDGDFTGDSIVNYSDLGVLATYYGWNEAAAAGSSLRNVIPEPAALSLLILGSIIVVFRNQFINRKVQD